MLAEVLAAETRLLGSKLDESKDECGLYTANPIAHEYYALARAALDQAERFAMLAHYTEIHGEKR